MDQPTGLQRFLDAPAHNVLLTRDALRVHAQQDINAVTPHCATWGAGTPPLSQVDNTQHGAREDEVGCVKDLGQ